MNNIPAPLIFILGCCLVFGKNRSWKLLKILGTNIIAAQEHSLFVDKTSIGFFRVMENGCLLGHDFLGIGSIFLLHLSWLMYKFQFYLPPTSITIICSLFQECEPISLPDFIFSWNDQLATCFGIIHSSLLRILTMLSQYHRYIWSFWVPADTSNVWYPFLMMRIGMIVCLPN